LLPPKSNSTNKTKPSYPNPSPRSILNSMTKSSKNSLRLSTPRTETFQRKKAVMKMMMTTSCKPKSQINTKKKAVIPTPKSPTVPTTPSFSKTICPIATVIKRKRMVRPPLSKMKVTPNLMPEMIKKMIT